MKKIFLACIFFASILTVRAQDENDNENLADTAWKHEYRGTYPKINDLVHTKLDVRFDYMAPAVLAAIGAVLVAAGFSR